MIPFVSFRNSTFIGLDIHANEIRLLQLQFFKKEISIKHAEVATLPLDTIIEGKIQQKDAFQACLRSLIHKNKLKGFPAAITLPTQCIITRKIQLAAGLAHIERKAEINENLHHYFPEVTEELIYDYALLESNNALEKNILLVAARQEQLRAYVYAIEWAGIKVKYIDVDISAFLRALTLNVHNFDIEPCKLIVHQEDYLTQVILLYKKEMIFHQQLQNRMQEEIANQIKYAVEFCTLKKIKLNKIYITGLAPALINQLAQQFHMDTEFVDFFKYCKHAQSFTFAYKMLQALGLALRGMQKC